MEEKLEYIVEKLGPIQGIKDYHVYLLSKAGHDISKFIAPTKASKKHKK